ncbi:hypothetical protein PSFL107428_23485 [Pseudoalteromonas maricaloris]
MNNPIVFSTFLNVAGLPATVAPKLIMLLLLSL